MPLVPVFPQYKPVSNDMGDELRPFFQKQTDGICEYTLASVLLDNHTCRYTISRVSDGTLLLCGHDADGKRFLSLVGDFPDEQTVRAIIASPDVRSCAYIKNLSERNATENADIFSALGLLPRLDRDNCDYLYRRDDLAFLRGKAFHKKKNLVNGFHAAYSAEVRAIDDATVNDAQEILRRWRDARQARNEDNGDFSACAIALQNREPLRLAGIIVYVDGTPAGFSLGEVIAGGTMFATHFEKGIDGVHGIYQAVNNEQAKMLPASVTLINREQDLGDDGLRQAKLSYRPCAFVNKYRVELH